MHSDLSGQVAIVTGGANGLGLVIVKELVENNASVMIVDRDGAGLAAAAKEFNPDQVLTAQCDVRDPSEVESTVAKTKKCFGGIDYLVTAAGTSTNHLVSEMPESAWDLVFDVNVKGTYLFCKEAARLMRPGGSIVTIASREGKRPSPGFAHYGASKAAVISLTRSLALELAPRIRVNSVCPGLVDTSLVRKHLAAEAQTRRVSEEALLAEWAADIPLARLQPATAIAKSVVFLASDLASEITGQALSVDGGSVPY